MKSLAVRRHHLARRKAYAKKVLKHWNPPYTYPGEVKGNTILRRKDATDPRKIGITANTPKPCSRPCCGNPRAIDGDPVRDKRKMFQEEE